MDKREAIMNAALELFAERGFHGTSVAQIADRAHVGAGTIYRYFEDKEVLVNALYQRWKREVHSYVKSELPMEAPPRQLFHELWSRMIAFSRKHPLVIKFLEFHHHAPYLDDTSRVLCDRIHEDLKAFLEICRTQQITKEAPSEVLLAILMGAYKGVEQARMNGEIKVTPENDALAEEICWEALRR
jgi:TetR/AcrR family transcriptional regulator, repressor of fatR-cypB operon